MSAAFSCEVPKQLRTRPRDRRGYPIPFVVAVDHTGKPHFTINDEDARIECLRKRLCGLCGKRLDDGYWFIGGPKCFLHVRGAFVDPPNHEACAKFAVQVCPYLANPSYGKRIDTGTLDVDAAAEAGLLIVQDGAMPDNRPALFMIGRASRIEVVGNGYLRAVTGWSSLEYWQHGARLEEAVGADLAVQS